MGVTFMLTCVLLVALWKERHIDNIILCFQGNYKYNMIGVGSGTYFFRIDQDTGRITVRVRPLEDSLQLDTYTVSWYLHIDPGRSEILTGFMHTNHSQREKILK